MSSICYDVSNSFKWKLGSKGGVKNMSGRELRRMNARRRKRTGVENSMYLDYGTNRSIVCEFKPSSKRI